MIRIYPHVRHILLPLLFVLLFAVKNMPAQTSAFNYQGSLSNAGNPANGSYDMQFRLFDAVTSGNQVGPTLTFDGVAGNPPPVAASNGIFTANLDFGGPALPGADRFLEISLRPAGTPGGYQQLLPRHRLVSVPYAVQAAKAASAEFATNAANASNASNSTNATQLGGVAASQYVLTGDPRMTDARNPLPNSPNYVQNTTASQASANFNIGGSGTANVLNATTQFNLNGSRILSKPGNSNLFVGTNAGQNNTNGGNNSFFGNDAGLANTTGQLNAFFGGFAGGSNTGGGSNAFFGTGAGGGNSTGSSNTFLGRDSGSANTTGSGNTFVGWGADAGAANFAGNNNTLLGAGTRILSGLSNSTAIGQGALVGQNNTIVLGSVLGVNGATATVNVGIGTTTPEARLTVVGTSAIHGGLTVDRPGTGARVTIISESATGAILLGDPGTGGNFTAIGFQSGVLNSSNWALMGGDGNTYVNRPSGGVVVFREGNGGNQVEIRPGGTVGIGVLDSAGSQPLCRNATLAISTCSSSARYKSNITPFASGLSLINRLRPVSFTWRDGGMLDMGLVAEEVAAVEPLLTTTNDKGQIEGVKYDRVGVVLINAVKEQQVELETQRKTIDDLRSQLNALKKFVCAANPTASVCRANNSPR